MEELKDGFRWSLLAREWRLAAAGFPVMIPLLHGSFGLGPEFFSALLFSGFLLFLSALDIRYGMIFDRFLLPMGVSGLLLDLSSGLGSTAERVAAAFFLGGLLLLIRWASHGGMGGGDVKLGWVLGLWLGWDAGLMALMLAFFLGSLLGICVFFYRRHARIELPFGPFLSIGAFFAMLYGERIMTWYLEMI